LESINNYIGVKALRRTRTIIFLLVFILLVFAPIILEVSYLNDFASILQNIFPYWKNRSNTLLLSDMLFLQGGIFIFLGALVAGVILYNAWMTTRRLFRKYISSIWNTEVMEKERRSPAGLAIGLILLGAGMAYILVGIAITI
jgi:hypothetical protein